jgi:hypothetical protein
MAIMSQACICPACCFPICTCILHQLEAIAVDPNAEGGVGSASGMQLLNMDLSRQAAAAQQQDEAAAAIQVGTFAGRLAMQCARAQHGPVTTSSSSAAAR